MTGHSVLNVLKSGIVTIVVLVCASVAQAQFNGDNGANGDNGDGTDTGERQFQWVTLSEVRADNPGDRTAAARDGSIQETLNDARFGHGPGTGANDDATTQPAEEESLADALARGWINGFLEALLNTFVEAGAIDTSGGDTADNSDAVTDDTTDDGSDDTADDDSGAGTTD